MKTSMDRRYPILVDIGTQIEQNPDQSYVFFYDDGSVYRAFVCDKIALKKNIVEVFRDDQVIITIPAETVWRLVHKDNLEFVLGSEMEEVELKNVKQKKDLQKRLIKDLNLEDKDPIEHEYKDGYNPKLYT